MFLLVFINARQARAGLDTVLVVEQQHPARILDPRVVAPVEKFGAAL